MSLGKRFVIDIDHATEVIGQARNHSHVAVCHRLPFKFGTILSVDFCITDSDVDRFFVNVFRFRQSQFRVFIDTVIIATEYDGIALDRCQFFANRFKIRQFFQFMSVIWMDSFLNEPQ